MLAANSGALMERGKPGGSYDGGGGACLDLHALARKQRGKLRSSYDSGGGVCRDACDAGALRARYARGVVRGLQGVLGAMRAHRLNAKEVERAGGAADSIDEYVLRLRDIRDALTDMASAGDLCGVVCVDRGPVRGELGGGGGAAVVAAHTGAREVVREEAQHDTVDHEEGEVCSAQGHHVLRRERARDGRHFGDGDELHEDDDDLQRGVEEEKEVRDRGVVHLEKRE